MELTPTKEQILAEYGRTRRELQAWLENATAEDLRRKSNGTKWTNEELLFHMVFGYMVVRALLPLVHTISRLPGPFGGTFAAVLNAGTRFFDRAIFWGSRAAAVVYNRHRMGRKMDKTIASLARRLERETPLTLSRSMPFPDRWDPFFASVMTVNGVYAYPTLHFDFHAGQLSLEG